MRKPEFQKKTQADAGRPFELVKFAFHLRLISSNKLFLYYNSCCSFAYFSNVATGSCSAPSGRCRVQQSAMTKGSRVMKCRSNTTWCVRQMIFEELIVLMNYWSNLTRVCLLQWEDTPLPPPSSSSSSPSSSPNISRTSHRGTLHLFWCAICFFVCFTHGWILRTRSQPGNMMACRFSPPVATQGTAEKTHWGPKIFFPYRPQNNNNRGLSNVGLADAFWCMARVTLAWWIVLCLQKCLFLRKMRLFFLKI